MVIKMSNFVLKMRVDGWKSNEYEYECPFFFPLCAHYFVDGSEENQIKEHLLRPEWQYNVSTTPFST